MFTRFLLHPIGLLLLLSLPLEAAEKLYSGPPIRALLITGGCCHNYPFQAEAITNAVNQAADARWTVINQGGTGTRGKIDLYRDPEWARPYDIVIHNECFADTDDAEYIRSITAAHRAGTPAMVIHCAMHTYRAAKIDDWREFLGVTSRMHEHQSRYLVKAAAPEHPVMKGFPDGWKTPLDELYVIEKVWPGTKALATSVSERTGQEQPVIWVHEYGRARVFGTTYGHSDETFRDPVFLNVLARGFVWTAGKMK